MDAHAVPQHSSGLVGVHLSWCGPPTWLFAPSGFTVQRRVARPPVARQCERLDAAAITELRKVRERRLPFGVVTLRDGGWLDGVDDLDPGEAAHTPTEVFRVELDADHRIVEVTTSAKLSFVVALHDGRAVGASGPEAGAASHRIRAPRLDTVVVYTLAPSSLLVCVDFVEDPTGAPPDDWHDIAPIVSGLTMPFRELMPALQDEADELAEASARLLPGEAIGADEFARLATAVRPMLTEVGPPRPSELSLLVRDDPSADADEARATDPVRMMLAHPTWRRVLGFAYFDDDPALVLGKTYEYRISATYPAPDVHDANHGFAAVPSGTLLPADFALDGPRVRVPRPVTVRLASEAPVGRLVHITRRGIPLDTTRESFWVGPGLDDWSLVVDFAAPVTAVVLELAPGHDLAFSAGTAIGSFLAVEPVPSGSSPRLDFAGPVEQLRLRGKGFLHTLRVPTVADTDKTERWVVVPPVTLADTPLPSAPLAAWATNLQQEAAAPTSLVPAAETAHRDALGFTVSWRPAPAFGVPAWPPDLDAAVPLDAAMFQIERRADPAGEWVPVLEDDNQVLGDRGGAVRELALAPGTDLAAVFPENAVRTSGADLDLHFVDSFSAVGDPTAGGRAPPEPGTLHRYRVRAIDSIGRPSADWLETTPVRLEKHVPPPIPVGVAARVLVPDAPDLTADERTLLGDSSTAVVLRWRWGDDQREQDPFATEFRVYAAPPMDTVAGTVTAVTLLSSGQVTSYRVDLQLDRPVASDIVAGQRLDAGHPFFIRSHHAGSTIQMIVETRLRPGGAAPVPAIGPVALALPLSPDRTRPPAWGARREVLPLHADPADTDYEVVLRDLITVSDESPRATAWVGVSAADDQAYVVDQLDPIESRPGNESAIVPAHVTARYHGRPVLEIPPPLAPVPRVRTPEPGAEPLHFPLDLTPFLPPAAAALPRVRTERVAVAAVLAACRPTDDDRILAMPVAPSGGESTGEPEVEIPIANPDDRAALVAQLRGGVEVEDRFAVYLAGHHPARDRLFVPVADELRPPGPFAETLPSSTGRFVYRVRAADQAGHLSAGAATAAVVVRVPSLRQGTPPRRLPSLPVDPPGTVRVEVAPDAELTHLAVFTAPITDIGPVPTSEIMRVPNRPDLLPGGGLFRRSPQGALLTPSVVALTDPPPGQARTVLVAVPGDPGDRTRIWLATLTADGIPSPVAGPYSFVHPVAVPS